MYNKTEVVQNKSSLLLKIIFTNTQALQLFMIYIYQKLFTKDIKMPSMKVWVLGAPESYNERDRAQSLGSKLRTAN